MKKCSYCNSTIVFGGKNDGDLIFCNDKCLENGYVLMVAQRIPEDILDRYVAKVHSGPCPKCQREGSPIDVHTAHFVWSAFILTSWVSKPVVCCRSCGIKSQIQNTVASALVGWWGFPWGLIMTPLQIGRNLVAICSSPKAGPSPHFRRMVSFDLATQYPEEIVKMSAVSDRDGN